jgi:peptidoglycan hydrolase CwlO-like protein
LKIPGEIDPREQELLQNVVDLDPFSGIDKNGVKEILKEEDEREHYTRADKISDLADEDWDKLVNQRQIRQLMDKDKTSLQNKIKQVQEHMIYLETQYQDIDEQYEAQTVA